MDSWAAWAIGIAALLYAGGAGLALVLPRSRVLTGMVVTTVMAGVAEAAAGIVLITGRAAFEANLYSLHPLGMLQLRADATSGLFLVLIGALTVGIGVYSQGYLAKFSRDMHSSFACLYHLLLVSLLGIVLANDLPLFLIAWEAMSILSYLLVTFGGEDRQIADAGFLMLAMSQIGSAAFVIAFCLLGSSVHGLGFDLMRANAASLPAAVRTGAFLLFFFGFGTKAGIVPLHVWLPVAHPAAPSNISALLSSVIINMGIYGILRFSVQMLGPGPAWWGLVVAGIGALSAILGILYALMERDIKRFLAFSTVENVGIILIALGASMVFASYHLHVLAALALVAAAFHTLNHATYKGLLFLGAGAVDYAVHIRNMDRLGGLIGRMAWTGGLFLVGALSIAGVPPFNGFISEWLTFETLLQSFHIADLPSRIGLSIAGVFLALTAGLAVTAFVKAYSVMFLGAARTPGIETAVEVPRSMRWGMGLLAVEAVVLGVLPTAFIPWFARVAAGTYGPNITAEVVPDVYSHPGKYVLLVHLGGALFKPVVPAPGPIVIPAYASFSAASPTYLAIAFAICVSGVWLVLRRVRQSHVVRRVDAWEGGIAPYTPAFQYTSSSFANPIRIIFGMIYRPGKEAETMVHESEYFRLSVTYRGYVVPVFEEYLYPAVVGPILALSSRVKMLQSGSVNLYLAYMLAILIVVLVLVR